MPADPLSLTASVANIVKAIISSSVIIHGIRNAPHEANHVAAQLKAVQATLTSLKTTFETLHRSKEFIDVWGTSARLVLDNVEVTMSMINERLGGSALKRGVATLGLWNRITWPFEREEALQLQVHLQGYMQMLSMIQNSLVQATIQAVNNSAHEIETILSEDGNYPITVAGPTRRSTKDSGFLDTKEIEHTWSASARTVLPNDSVSQFRLSPKQEIETQAIRSKSPRTHDQGRLRNIGSWDASYFSVRPHGQAKDLLGLGKVLVAVESGDTSSKLWIIFHSEGKKQHECRWFKKLSPGFVLPALHEDPNRGKAFITYKEPHGKTSSISVTGFYPDTAKQHDKSTSTRANLTFVLSEFAFNPFERTHFVQKITKAMEEEKNRLELADQRRTVQKYAATMSPASASRFT